MTYFKKLQAKLLRTGLVVYTVGLLFLASFGLLALSGYNPIDGSHSEDKVLAATGRICWNKASNTFWGRGCLDKTLKSEDDQYGCGIAELNCEVCPSDFPVATACNLSGGDVEGEQTEATFCNTDPTTTDSRCLDKLNGTIVGDCKCSGAPTCACVPINIPDNSDKVAPSVSFTNLQSNATISSDFKIEGLASDDNSGIKNVVIKFNASPILRNCLANYNATNNKWELQMGTTACNVLPATYKVSALATDKSGNQKEVTLSNITVAVNRPTSKVDYTGWLTSKVSKTNESTGLRGFGWYKVYSDVVLKLVYGDAKTTQIAYTFVSKQQAYLPSLNAPTWSCPAIGDVIYTKVNNNTDLAKNLNALKDGEVKLCFYAVTNAGVTESKVNEVLLKKDKTAPTLQILSHNIAKRSDNKYYLNTRDLVLKTKATDTNAGVVKLNYNLKKDNCSAATYVAKSYAIPTKVAGSSTLENEMKDFTNLSNGTYCLEIFATDDAVNASTSQYLVFVVDGNSNLSTPENLNYLNTNVTPNVTLGCNAYNINKTTGVKATWNNVTGASKYEVSVDYPKVAPAGERDSFTTTVTTNSLNLTFDKAEGIYGFKVRALDNNGNYSAWSATDLTSSCKVLFDKTAPSTSEVTSPLNGQTFENEVSFVGKTTDNFSVVKLTVYYRTPSLGQNVNFSGNETSFEVENNTNNVKSFLWNFAKTLTPGTYDFKFSGTDKAGNKEGSAYVYNVTVGQPSIATPTNLRFEDTTTNPISNLGCNGFTNKTTGVKAAWNSVTGAVKYEYFIDYPKLSPVGERGTWSTFVTTNFYQGAFNQGEGVHTFKVRAYGEGNLVSEWSSTCSITFDKSASQITVNPLITNQTSPALSGTVSDSNATVTVQIGSTTYTAVNNGDGTWSLAANTISALTEGVYDVIAVATDSANNKATDTTTNELTIDLTKPISTLSSPTDGTQYTTSVPFVGKTTDNIGLARVEIFYKKAGTSEAWVLIHTINASDLADDGSFSWTWKASDTNWPGPGMYDFKVRGVDIAGNEENSAYASKILMDSVAPTVKVDTTVLSQSLTLKLNTKDYTGVKVITLKTTNENGEVVASKTIKSSDKTVTDTVDTTKLANGSYTTCVITTDVMGNKSDCTNVGFEVKNGSTKSVTVSSTLASRVLDLYKQMWK